MDALGNAGPDKDYDIVILVTGDAPAVGRFEDRLHLTASVPATVLREGKLLYAASSDAR
jgi:hypothetical protein